MNGPFTARPSPAIPRNAFHYLDGLPHSFLERVLDAWFAPKRFESTRLYERLGVGVLKKYVPTGGDFFIRRFGVRVVDVRADLDSLIQFEHITRIWEAIHELFFVGFTSWSLWRSVTHRTSWAGFAFGLAVYIVLILSPVMLQRYNRLRLYPLIRRAAAGLSRRQPA